MMTNKQNKIPFPTWPHYEADEIAAASRVLESGKVNYWNGEEGIQFEREFALHHGAKYGVAVANGSVALELALYALGIATGDEVVVTPRTFIASASSIVMRDAHPVFVDVDSNSGNITPQMVRDAVTDRTRAILLVHLGGWPCDMSGFRALADEFDLSLIEDCAQAHGARFFGGPVGSFGDAACFSFCTDKIMSTGGEGGMVLFKDEQNWRRAWSYKDHGKDWDAVHCNTGDAPGFKWLHESFGTNWRLTEMQSAIGRVQLKKLDHWLDRRRRNAQILIDGLSGVSGLRVPVPDEHVKHAYYKFYVYVRPELLKSDWNRDRILQAVQGRGIPCMQGICPEVYIEKAFKDSASKWSLRGHSSRERLEVAKALGETSLMFMVHPTLEKENMLKTVEIVAGVMQEAIL